MCNNLKFSLVNSLGYFIKLKYSNLKYINALTKDLQIKWFILNNLDNTVEKRNKEVFKFTWIKSKWIYFRFKRIY